MTAPVLAFLLSIAARNEMMDGQDDVECEPGARHDDYPSMIVRRQAVLPDLALVEFRGLAAILDRLRRRLSRLWFIGAFAVRRQRISRDWHDNLRSDVHA